MDKTGKDTHRKPKRRNFVIGLKIADRTTPPSGGGFKTCINYANELENEARVQNQFGEQNAMNFYKEEISYYYHGCRTISGNPLVTLTVELVVITMCILLEIIPK